MQRQIVTEFPPNPRDNLQIITPSRAIANFLAAPHYSLESLAQNTLRRQGWSIASALLSRRLLQEAVRETIETKDIVGTARVLSTTIRELFHSGSDLIALQQNSSSRVQQLASLALAYQQSLRRQKLIDPAEVFWHCQSDRRCAYLFYGYLIPAPDELAFIDGIAGDGSIIVLPDSSEASGWLRERGWELGNLPLRHKAVATRKIFAPQASDRGLGNANRAESNSQNASWQQMVLHSYPNLNAEVRGVLTQVKNLLSRGVKAKDIVLVAREEQLYGETLIDVAWEFELTVRVWYEVPLESTRIGAWLMLLMEVIETDFAFEATAKLLSHPLVRQMPADIWQRARTTYPQNFTAWQELGLDLSLLNFPQVSSRRDWIWRLQEIFSTWKILENSNKWAREIIAFYRVREALIELAKPETEKLGKRTLVREIRELLVLLCVPAQPGRGGVELHAPTSLFGTQYRYVFVLGMAEGIFPPSLTDDRVLDFGDRAKLARKGFKIDTAVEIAQREAFIASSLIKIPIERITFSYPLLMAKNSVLPSPYLTRWGLQLEPVPILPVPSIEAARRLYLPSQTGQLRDRLIPQITQAWQVELNRELQSVPDEYDGIIGMAIALETKTFSASQLTQLGQCPFKWFSARLLKLKELPEAQLDLSSAFRGSLYHRCLELSLENIATATDLEKFNFQQLERAFTQAERELELTQLPGWDVQRQEHLQLLALNFTAPELLPPDRKILARETEFETTWYGLQMRGTVDRIDRVSEGLTVIDYKTSSTKPTGVKDETGKASLDIQLALYRDAIETAYPQTTVVSAIYYSLTKRQPFKPNQSEPGKLAAFAERVKFYLERGHYPVAPDVDNKACQYCCFDLVCRKGDRLTRKKL